MSWETMYKKYAGLWVALKDDQRTVLSSAKSAKEALNLAQKKGYSNPLLNYVPKKLINFIG